MFYALPVAQLVLTYQRVVNTSGNQDICYYNNFCQRPYHLFRYASPDLLFRGCNIFIQFNYNMESSDRYYWLWSIILVNEVISCFRSTVTLVPITFRGWFTKVVRHFIPRYFCTYPVGIYLFKVNNRNTRTRCEICSKLTIKDIIRWLFRTVSSLYVYCCCHRNIELLWWLFTVIYGHLIKKKFIYFFLIRHTFLELLIQLFRARFPSFYNCWRAWTHNALLVNLTEICQVIQPNRY